MSDQSGRLRGRDLSFSRISRCFSEIGLRSKSVSPVLPGCGGGGGGLGGPGGGGGGGGAPDAGGGTSFLTGFSTVFGGGIFGTTLGAGGGGAVTVTTQKSV